MKKIFLLCLFLILVFLPAKTWAAEHIAEFELEFQINKDSSVDVTEKIEYDFDNLQKHGIFRNIPVKYEARGGNYSLRLSDISVTDENGMAHNFTKSSSGGDLVIKIGDADKFVTGKKIYVIKYKVKRALNYFEDHDEFYWNAIGNQWKIPHSKCFSQGDFARWRQRCEIRLFCGVLWKHRALLAFSRQKHDQFFKQKSFAK